MNLANGINQGAEIVRIRVSSCPFVVPRTGLRGRSGVGEFFQGLEGGGGAVFYAQFLEDVLEVPFHRSLGHLQDLADHGVACPPP
jgi:hypothetical protein